MLTYDPNVTGLINEIPEREEMPINEEIARQALTRDPEASQKTVPTGLLRPEKKIDESQMADFSTPIEEFQAALAGAASVIAFSKPVQSRLRTMVPKFVGESGDVSLTGLAVTAFIAALVFYIIKKYVIERA